MNIKYDYVWIIYKYFCFCLKTDKKNKNLESCFIIIFIEKYSSQGLIDYKEALARISINPGEEKPLNTDWILRSAHSSMRNSTYTSQNSRLGSSQSPNLITNLRNENNNKKIDNEFDKIKVNKQISSNELNEIIPNSKDVMRNIKTKTPMSSKLLSQKGRGTPSQIDPMKLINQQMKSKHETKFNIITNKDKLNQGLDKAIEESDKMISTTMGDYQDLSKCTKIFLITYSYQENNTMLNFSQLEVLWQWEKTEGSWGTYKGSIKWWDQVFKTYWWTCNTKIINQRER